jgi:hypothetical protein
MQHTMISKKAFSRAASVSINSWALGSSSLKFDSEWFQRGNFNANQTKLFSANNNLPTGRERELNWKSKKTPIAHNELQPVVKIVIYLRVYTTYTLHIFVLCVSWPALLPRTRCCRMQVLIKKRKNKNLFFGANKVIIWRHYF